MKNIQIHYWINSVVFSKGVGSKGGVEITGVEKADVRPKTATNFVNTNNSKDVQTTNISSSVLNEPKEIVQNNSDKNRKKN